MRLVLIGALVLVLVGCAGKPAHQGRSLAQLQRMLADPDPRIQSQGAHGLGLLGEEAAPAVAALAKALKAADPRVREEAARALGEIGPEAATAAAELAALLTDHELEVRYTAVKSLGLIGPEARHAAEEGLKKSLRDSNQRVRRAAQESLASVKD